MSGVLARKIGMTRVFDDKGDSKLVTALLVVPSKVIRIKNKQKDGYAALVVRVGLEKYKGEAKKQTAKTNATLKYKKIKEFPASGDLPQAGIELGSEIFEAGDLVKVSGVSKGKGFAGTIKRHGFKRGPETHGSDHHRAPGSIGSMFPQRVLKGKKMAGRMGGERVTLRNRPILKVLQDKQIILIEGSLPGPNNSWLKIEKMN